MTAWRAGREWAVWIGLLGPLLATDDAGAVVQLAGARLRVLLAVLALNAGNPVAGDALADFVWDGAPPSGYAATLRSHVMRLRKALPAARIENIGMGYTLGSERLNFDVAQFEALCIRAAAGTRAEAWQEALDASTAALALWRGAPLIDVPSQVLRDRVLPRFERFRVQAFEDRAEAGLRLGRHGQVAAELREVVAAHPLRERFHTQLILALYHSGRQAEALAAYHDARTVFIDELGVEPGSELQGLHERILAGDGDPSALRPGAGADPAVSPRQLPTAAAHFTGRKGELVQLVGLVESSRQADTQGTVVISAIDGMAGIGKTAFAVKVAHRLAEKFRDGQLYVDLHGYSRGQHPRDPLDVLQWWLRALGEPPQRIPQDVEECAALYRQRLASSRTLIVLDNALDEAQVRPLLPGASECLVLVTSRRQLKGLDDARSLSLDLLPRADAMVLLRAVAGPGRVLSDESMLGTIVELCGRLPLAVRIAAALLRHRPSWSLEYLADMLRDPTRRVQALSDGERDLSAVFNLSYASLDVHRQLAFHRLSLIPGPQADAYAAAALLRTDPATAGRLLEDLVDHNVLIGVAPGRYRLHDLLRAYADVRARDDPDSVPAADRLMSYYQHTCGLAEQLVRPYHSRPATSEPAPAYARALPDRDSAWSWLRTERANLLAALDQATARAIDAEDETTARTATSLVLGLTAGLASLLRTDGPWDWAARAHTTAAGLADRFGDPSDAAGALIDLVRVHILLGDYPQATSAVSEALSRYQQTGELAGQADALSERGQIRAETGALDTALEDLRRSLALYAELGDRRGQATARFRLGSTTRQLCDYAGAADELQHALRLYQELDERLGQANTLIELGRICLQNGDNLAAIADLTRALRLHQDIGDRHGQASARLCLGQARSAGDDAAGAVADLEEALRLYRSLASPLGRATALAQLGTARRLLGDHAGALSALEDSLQLLRSLGVPGGEAWALTHYAAAIRDAGDVPNALATYQRALALSRETRQSDDEAVAREGIGDCRLRTGTAAAGIDDLRAALTIYQRLNMTVDADRVHAQLIRYTSSG